MRSIRPALLAVTVALASPTASAQRPMLAFAEAISTSRDADGTQLRRTVQIPVTPGEYPRRLVPLPGTAWRCGANEFLIEGIRTVMADCRYDGTAARIVVSSMDCELRNTEVFDGEGLTSSYYQVRTGCR